jgi:hypothetical protein
LAGTKRRIDAVQQFGRFRSEATCAAYATELVTLKPDVILANTDRALGAPGNIACPQTLLLQNQRRTAVPLILWLLGVPLVVVLLLMVTHVI